MDLWPFQLFNRWDCKILNGFLFRQHTLLILFPAGFKHQHDLQFASGFKVLFARPLSWPNVRPGSGCHNHEPWNHSQGGFAKTCICELKEISEEHHCQSTGQSKGVHRFPLPIFILPHVVWSVPNWAQDPQEPQFQDVFDDKKTPSSWSFATIRQCLVCVLSSR